MNTSYQKQQNKATKMAEKQFLRQKSTEFTKVSFFKSKRKSF